MGHYQSCTPKRHYAYSNSRVIKRIDKGKLQGWKPKSGKKIETAERYIDKSGKKRYKGTKSLRDTEIYPVPFAREVCDLMEEMKQTCQGQPQADKDPSFDLGGEKFKQLDLQVKRNESIRTLKDEIANLDKAFDNCQEVWTNGEAHGFFTETSQKRFFEKKNKEESAEPKQPKKRKSPAQEADAEAEPTPKRRAKKAKKDKA
eukprot:Skav231197  [mRNA]  locus=scaffold2432:37207:42079:- [translate_table: standard]